MSDPIDVLKHTIHSYIVIKKIQKTYIVLNTIMSLKSFNGRIYSGLLHKSRTLAWTTKHQKYFSTTSITKQNRVHFHVNTDDAIGILTLNAPKQKNALTIEMASEFQSLIFSIKDDLTHNRLHINSIILKGADGNFSSGGDLTWLKSLRHNPVHINADIMYNFYNSFLCIRQLPIPIISVIEGYAVGAGACLAIATDLRIMSSQAKIGFNFVKIGISSGMGGSHLLPIAVGETKAMDILLRGKVLTGKEAYDMGMVHEIYDETGETLFDRGVELAKELNSMHPVAMRNMVQTMRIREDNMGSGIDTALRREAHIQSLCYARDDWGEGLNAAIERRNPSFDRYHHPRDAGL